MTRVRLAGLLTAAALVGGFLTGADGARPEAYDLKGRSGSLGQIPLISVDDGASYVAADRLAALLKGVWAVKGTRGTLTVGKQTARFVKDQARVLIQDQPLTLEGAPRVGAAGWLLPESFLSKGLGRLAPGVSAIALASDPKKPKAVKVAVALEELRYRSYPSFTRVVVETGGTLSYAVVAAAREIRVRLPGLVLSGPRIEEVADGLVKELRLEPVGRDAVLRVVLEGVTGEVRDSALQDPFRLVLDIYRPKEPADLFVSIHANAHPRAVSEGVETYFLSSEASDSEARQTAAIENGVVQLESPASRQKADLLKSILWDLAQSEFQQESSFMAETVQDSMTQSLSLVNRGVKQAGFYVLGGAAMPAILIEVGFLTNRKEEKKLATPEYREAVARAIYTGLAEYKRRYDQRLRTAQTGPTRAASPRRDVLR